MKPLDFIVIGAQKSGTTSLLRYMNEHPEIYQPDWEFPYFCIDEKYEQGWAVAATEEFADADEQQVWGKKTPHYMGDMRVPERIKTEMPDVKLIAILRDPVERTFSHYRMGVRHQGEERSFEEAITTQLNRTPTGPYTYPLDKTECYVTWSEYGRILETYTEHFDRDSLFVLFTDDLKQRPAEILQALFRFLEVDDQFVPDNIGTRYHRGTKKDLMHSVVQTVRRIPVVYPLWRRLGDSIKAPVHSLLDTCFDRFGPSSTTDYARMSPDIRHQLERHFRTDLETLRRLDVNPPWVWATSERADEN